MKFSSRLNVLNFLIFFMLKKTYPRLLTKKGLRKSCSLNPFFNICNICQAEFLLALIFPKSDLVTIFSKIILVFSSLFSSTSCKAYC
ncbi:hypothetical protein MCERE19_02944 [Spirosomataceae bacterium]